MINNIVTEVAGLVGVLPKIIYIQTNDTLAQVIATGYLNAAAKQGYQFSEYEMALVSTKTSPSDTDVDLALFQVEIVGANISLVSLSGPGSVALPTIVNHIATFTNTGGAIGEDASTAINGGNIQAGLSGTAGYLASFPATLAKGSLRVVAVANTGDTLVTISNAAMGQASVISIPDPGVATSSFLLKDSAGTQTIATGNLTITLGNLLVSAGTITAAQGNIQAGSSGHAGTLISFPGTAAKGSLILAAVNNTGNTNVTISNVAMGQASVVSIPDPGNAAAQFLVAATATPFTANHLAVASGTSGLMVDAGFQMKSVAQAAVAGGAAAQTVTDAFCTSASMVVASWNDTSTAVTIQKVAAGNGSFVVTSSADPGASHISYIITKV